MRLNALSADNTVNAHLFHHLLHHIYYNEVHIIRQIAPQTKMLIMSITMILMHMEDYSHSNHHKVLLTVQSLFRHCKYTPHRCIVESRKVNVITHKKTTHFVRMLPDDYELAKAPKEIVSNALVQIALHQY